MADNERNTLAKGIAQFGRVISAVCRSSFVLLFLWGSSHAFAQAKMATPGGFSVGASGAATYSIPIEVPPGTAGMQPNIAMGYNSQGGNGLLGMGWSLAGFSAITRCPKTIAQDGAPSTITVTNTDAFCLDGQRLFPVSGANGVSGTEYRTEIESFSRITSTGVQGNGPANFMVESKSGQILTYQPFAQVFPNTAYTWAVNMVRDKLNNCLQITYSQGVSGYELYPTQIDYSGRYSNGTCTGTYNRVSFVYENRPDPFTGFAENNYSWLKVRLLRIDTANPAGLVKRYQLAYQAPAPATGRSRLSSVTECDNFGCVAGHMLPATTFFWQDGVEGFDINGNGTATVTGLTDAAGFSSGNRFFQMDINGDGRGDLLTRASDGTFTCHLSNGAGFTQSNLTLASGFTDANSFNTGLRFFPMDVNGDGQGDLVIRNGNGNLIAWILEGCSISSSSTVTPTTLTDAAGWNSGQRFFVMDMNADGRADLVARSIAGNLSIYLSTGTGFTLLNTSPSYLPDAGGWNDPTRFLPMDQNADGIGDLVTRQSNGHLDRFFPAGGGSNLWGVSPSNNALSDAAGYNAGQRLFPMDANGDGRTDVVARDSNGNLLVQLSYGSGFAQTSSTPTGLTDAAGWNTGNRFFIMDVNGDGRTDLVARDTSGNFLIYRSTDGGFVLAYSSPMGLSDAAGWNAGYRFFVMDVDGDGRADIVTRAADGTLTTRRAVGTAPDLMRAAVNGLGAQTTFTYSPLPSTAYSKGTGSTYPTADVNLALYVVSNSGLSDGIGGAITTNYQYGWLRTDLQGRGSLGFNYTIATRPTDPFNTQTIITYYSQTYPYTGLVTKQEVYVGPNGSLAPRLLKFTQNSFATTSALPSPTQTTSTRYFPYISSTLEQNYDYTTGGLVSSTTTNFAYGDGWGNPTTISVNANDGFTGSTTNTYLNNSASWVIGRLTSSIVTRGVTGQTAQTRTASFAPDGNTGLTTQEVIEPNNAALKIISDYGYDIYGNRTSVTVRTDLPSTSAYWFPSRTTTTNYVATTANPIAGQFPNSSTNATGTQSESYEYDGRFGGRTKLTGPNAIATSWAYDTFGRLSTETRADGTSSTITYAPYSNAALPTARYTITSQSTGQPTKIGYFDRLNRELRTAVTHFSGTSYVISGVKVFDGFGRSTNAYRNYNNASPVAAPGSTSFSTVTYDPIGRVLTTTAPNNLVTNYSYDGLTTTVTVAGQITKKTVNSQGWTTSTTDAASKVTLFTYDPNGNLLTTTDPKLNKVSMTYDLKGRKTGMNDPDMGVWTYVYDALGQLKSQTDAKAQTTMMVYDLLGRMTQRNEPSLISNFYYDKYADNTACNKGVGKLCEVTTGAPPWIGSGYRRKHYYDNLGRSSRTDNYVEGSATALQQIDTTFDAAGRVDIVTYPNVTIGAANTRLQVKNNYNAAGYLFKITNPTGTLAYWTATAVDADGHVTNETLGNGLVTVRGYETLTGRLSSINTGSGSTQNMTFTYDSLGNLIQRTDAFPTPSAATITENYGYDALNRLKTVGMTGTTTLNKSYDYDDIGNITRKSDLGGTGIYTYPASGAGSVRPHAVTSVNGVINNVTNPTYTYDANGNMISAFAGSRTINYTSFNMPLTVLRNGFSSSWVYDADHNRIKQATNNAPAGQAPSIYYVNPGNQPFFEKHVGVVGSGLTEYRHFIGGVAVYTQYSNAATAVTKYLLRDYLGSTTVVTNSGGGVLERYSYDAFGKTRNLNGSDTASNVMTMPSTRRAFTDHEMLPEIGGGMIHMNGRIYDPNLGRFMTADPHVQAAGYSQSYNRYSYGFNNPLSGTDPSGFSWKDWDPAYSTYQTSRAVESTLRNPGEIFNWYALEHSLPGRAAMDKHVFSHDWGQTIGHIAIAVGSYWCGAAAIACVTAGEAHIAGYNTWLAGGDHDDVAEAVITAGAISAMSVITSRVIGIQFPAASAPVSNILAHAVAGCAIGEISGGSCGAGALSHGVTAAVDIGLAEGGVLDTRGALGETGGFFGNMAISVAAGCLSSHAGGGTCEAGARSSAIIYLYNHGGGLLPEKRWNGFGPPPLMVDANEGIARGIQRFFHALGNVIDSLVYQRPPANAYDPYGPKAPGKPGSENGFTDPKNGDTWVANPNGRGNGWQDAKGDVWVPTGQGGSAHGGPHWDVQTPGGGYRNVKP